MSTNGCDFYFGYGSNLNAHDLGKWGVSAAEFEPVCRAYLPDRELRFTRYSADRAGGVLDVVPLRGSAVPGMIFRVREREVWGILDGKEGIPEAYRRIRGVAIDFEGKLCDVLTYEVSGERRDFVAAGEQYAEIVSEGLRSHGLPEDHLQRARQGTYPTSAIDSIFVYGTLMRGERNHHLMLGGAQPDIKSAETSGILVDCRGYPGMVLEGAERSRIRGEWYRFRSGGPPLAELDQLEDFRGFGEPGSLYNRTIIRVTCDDGSGAVAWCYILQKRESAAEVITCSDWRQYRLKGA